MKKLLFLILLTPSAVFARNGTVLVIDKLAPRNAAFVGVVDASQTVVNISSFSKNLSSSDIDVQHALNTIDKLTVSGGGGGSALAVGTGTASNFSNSTSSPTTNLGFYGAQFIALGNGTTSIISLNQSSVTLQGNFVAGTNITLSPSGGVTTIAAAAGSGYSVEPATVPFLLNQGMTGSYARLTSTGPSSIPLTVYASSAQAFDLMEWKGRSGVVVTYVDADGNGIFPIMNATTFSATSSAFFPVGINPTLITSSHAVLLSTGLSSIPLTVIGYPNQNFDLFEIKGSTTVGVVVFVDSNGNSTFPIVNATTFSASAIALFPVGINTALITNGHQVISSTGTNSIPLTILGSSGQIYDLTEWKQNNVVTAYINAAGVGNFPQLVSYGHIEISSGTPVLSACGSSPSIVGNDMTGKITIGGGVQTSCTVTFYTPWSNAPACWTNSNTALTSFTATTTSTALTLAAGATFGGDIIMYGCLGYR